MPEGDVRPTSCEYSRNDVNAGSVLLQINAADEWR